MALTLAQLHDGLHARVASVSGLKPATGPLGVDGEPSTLIDGAFDVIIGDDSDAGERVRNADHIVTAVQFAVRLVHRLPVKGGSAGRNQALTDSEAVRNVLLNAQADGIKECQNTITYGGTTREERGGGAYLLTTLRWAVRIVSPMGV